MSSILNLIEVRKNYPVGRMDGESEFNYITDNLIPEIDEQFLVLPQTFFDSSRKTDQELKKILFTDWKLKAIFDLDSIWAPLTSIKFILLVLTKQCNQDVFFSNYLGDKAFKSKGINQRLASGELGPQEISTEYLNYIDFIEKKLFLNSEEVNQKDFQFWSIPSSEVNLDYLRINYYDPLLIENEKNLQSEDTLALNEVTDILHSRKVSDKKVKTIKPKDLKYPLKLSQLKEDFETSIVLEPGDIIFCNAFNGKQTVFLYEGCMDQKVYASSFLRILRLKSSRINPEYLFLYLQSEVIQKYFKRYLKGSMFSNLSISDLKSLPVVIPSLEIQETSRTFFKAKFLKPKENILEEINKQIFSKPDPKKPIQKEFFLESLENLKVFKKEILQSLFADDFAELEKAKNNKMYKAFFILAGSILETFLLDWLSEEEGTDYFHSKGEITLINLIKNLFSNYGKIPDTSLLKSSNYIREKRNLIHPKKALEQRIKFKESDCNEILGNLKRIFAKRGFN
jgi:hypothetical protein